MKRSAAAGARAGSSPFRALEEKRISPAEYAKRTKEETARLLKQSPFPKRSSK